MEMQPLNLQLDPNSLRGLVREITVEVLAVTEAAQRAIPDRLAYSEEEAAALMGLETHQLRDERLRGRIEASRIVGRRIRYQREDLIKYLTERKANQS